MLHAPATEFSRSNLDMPSLLEVLARTSSRPRYAFMVLNLIAQVARSDGSAGPLIVKTGALIPSPSEPDSAPGIPKSVMI